MLPDAVTTERAPSVPRVPTPCTRVVDRPADGAWNMALDEALLERAIHHNEAALRFYQWREPTLSLGYAQRYADRALHPASQISPAVRRLSGGGALLHDRELTYSLALPAASPLASQPASLYTAVHATLIETLADFGVTARLHGPAFPPPNLSPLPAEPFLCFARRGANDVVLPSAGVPATLTKIVGSAQRRSHGAVLQHGAVLLERSPQAPELPGANDLASIQLDVEQLIAPWSTRLAARLNLQLYPSVQPAPPWHERAHDLAEKYASRAWTARR